jgi:hypothetical protein
MGGKDECGRNGDGTGKNKWKNGRVGRRNVENRKMGQGRMKGRMGRKEVRWNMEERRAEKGRMKGRVERRNVEERDLE